MLDLVFPAFGETVPTDHAYPLYAALSQAVPAFHDRAAGLRFATLGGVPDAPGRLRLAEWSRLRVRLPDDGIRLALPLAGKRLEVAGGAVRLGVPEVRPLIPAPTLAARLVTFKVPKPRPPHRAVKDAAPLVGVAYADDLERFQATAWARLRNMDIEGEPTVPVFPSGPRSGEPRRRVLRIKGKAIVGYALVVSGLSAEHSILLQEQGLGGRGRMGCGFFLPVREDK